MFTLFLYWAFGFIFGFLTIWFLYDENKSTGFIILNSNDE